jgi:hypothetical protein
LTYRGDVAGEHLLSDRAVLRWQLFEHR